MKYQFRPRKSFERNLSYLAKLDNTIIDETRDAVRILLAGDTLSKEYHDHDLEGYYAGYREFHLRDSPKGKQPTKINDIVVIYKIKDQDLILIAVDIGSHTKLFHDRYHKPK